MSVIALSALVVIVFVAFFTEAVVGFGATVITLSLAANFLDLTTILPAFVPLSAMLSLSIVSRNWIHIARGFLWSRLMPAMAIGMGIGMFLFRTIDSKHLLTVFGVFVCVVSVKELFQLTKAYYKPVRLLPVRALPPVVSFLLLTVGGVIHGIFGSGGPLVVYVAGRELPSKTTFRATLSALWLASNIVLVFGYVQSGMFTADTARLSAWMLPALMAGLWLGEKAHHAVNEKTFKFATWGILLFASFSLLGRSLL